MAYWRAPDGLALYCEYGYETATPARIKAIVNGCGPGGWKFDLVPDTMYGLNVNDACNIHDWMYEYGTIIDDKERADRSFLNNLLRIVEARTTKGFGRGLLLTLRRRRCKTYYEAVSHFGGPAFWDGKYKQKVA
jgi:hypothetical protein